MSAIGRASIKTYDATRRATFDTMYDAAFYATAARTRGVISSITSGAPRSATSDAISVAIFATVRLEIQKAENGIHRQN